MWPTAFEHRFGGGELDGHALGNLVLVGLAETLGDFAAALDEAGRLLGAVGRVLPATIEPVVLKADVDGRRRSRARSRWPARAGPHPPGRARPGRRAAPCPDALAAIARGRPGRARAGSLYTSVLAGARACPSSGTRSRAAPGRVVQVANLRPQVAETAGLDGADHLRAVLDHGGRVDAFLYDPDGGARRSTTTAIRALGVEPVGAPMSPAPTASRTIRTDWRSALAALL